ncbi:MAG: DNA polymerase I [Elusimicrobiota bacterium]
MKPRFYLIDAHAFLHRAYHALPPLSNSRGEPVGALYGFARMLLQIIRRDKPDRIAVCFDSPGPTFRHQLYSDYKANRKKTDEDLVVQLKRAREMAEAMGFGCVQAPGYEADDIMATLAQRAAAEGMEAVLVTGDKDALQMVGDSIRVFNPGRNVWMDAAEIEKKLGVGPGAVVDYLVLVGDSADNVPGVSGIGPAGAAKLLKRYGSVEKIVAAARANDEGVSPKIAAAVLSARREMESARRLIELRRDAPVPDVPGDFSFPEPEREKITAVFGALEFHSLLKEILPDDENAAPSPAPSSEIVAAEFKSARKILAQSAKISVVAALSPKAEPGDFSQAALVLGSDDAGICELIGADAVQAHRKDVKLLLGGRALKCGHGIKETISILDAWDLELAQPWFDARLAAYCLNPSRSAQGVDVGTKTPLSWRAKQALESEELVRRMRDAGVLDLYREVELPLVKILRDMERIGVAVDEPYLIRLKSELESSAAGLKADIDALAQTPLNVNSPKQLAALLFDKLGLPVIHKTGKGGRSTDEETLRALSSSHAIPGKVLEYREIFKLKSTYVEGLLQRLDHKTGRVHTTFDQTGAETGRLSSLNPNLQNIPIRSRLGQKIRRVFVAQDGDALISADYSQIDLRVLAHMSEDPVLMDAFSKNEDVHLRTACEIFHVSPGQVDKEMRRRAKAVNFGIVYGQTPFGLAGELGISQAEAADVIRRYFERYRGVAEWFEKNLESARRSGIVRTFLGRIRHMPELSSKNAALRQFGERAARNTPIQGGSADIIKLAMIAVARETGRAKTDARMILQIHDELLFEVPRAAARSFAARVKKIMEGAASLRVPLRVDVKIGPNWQDMEVAA